jgi:hypothetical protein
MAPAFITPGRRVTEVLRLAAYLCEEHQGIPHGAHDPHRGILPPPRASQIILYYHHARNHQGLGNKIISPAFAKVTFEGAIRCRERQGRLLRYYYREAP